MFFIGVSTGQSSIHRIFPHWARFLDLGPCELRGLDFPLHAPPRNYREAIDFMKHDPLIRGALVTTHKMDLHAACRDLFDQIEPLSDSMGEVSSLYKRNGNFLARAVDPWTVGLSLASFLSPRYWRATGAEVCILGAGGSSLSLVWHLCQVDDPENRPAVIHVANRSLPRLEHLARLHESWGSGVPLQCHHVPKATLADCLVAGLRRGSLVVNATGLGKDAPGSPVTNDVIFPQDGLIWEFNYRGDLLFLQQAYAQAESRQLTIEDGWKFFVHGWTQVIGDVFERSVPSSGPVFDELSRLAAACR